MSELPTAITVLIVDDHPVVRDGLRGVFATEAGITVCGEAANGAEAVAFVRRQDVDVVLMDLRMPVLGGVDAIRALRAASARAHVLVLTTFDADSDVLPAIEAGATGYLLKDATAAELVRAVRAAAVGEATLAGPVATRLMSHARGPAPTALSDREVQVLELVAAGLTNREAADRLFISEATVKTHLVHLYAKLEVGDRAAAVAVAYQRGLLGG
jgi:DNA-binding NarL/FixJ family response regulator